MRRRYNIFLKSITGDILSRVLCLTQAPQRAPAVIMSCRWQEGQAQCPLPLSVVGKARHHPVKPHNNKQQGEEERRRRRTTRFAGRKLNVNRTCRHSGWVRPDLLRLPAVFVCLFRLLSCKYLWWTTWVLDTQRDDFSDSRQRGLCRRLPDILEHIPLAVF